MLHDFQFNGDRSGERASNRRAYFANMLEALILLRRSPWRVEMNGDRDAIVASGDHALDAKISRDVKMSPGRGVQMFDFQPHNRCVKADHSYITRRE